MKSISAGLILTDGNRFLGCHSTGNYFYDLPKGTIKEGEEAVDACIREAAEETGICVPKSDLIDLGFHEYNHYKDLHLFLYPVDSLPDVKDLVCSSYFYHPIQKTYRPEADGFKYIAFDNMQYYLTKNMFKVMNDVFAKTKKIIGDLLYN